MSVDLQSSPLDYPYLVEQVSDYARDKNSFSDEALLHHLPDNKAFFWPLTTLSK